ncbi:MAG: YidH family protein [Burkholderiaceae bacterium]
MAVSADIIETPGVETMQHGRRPSWQQDGKEPDYRFSLANERTYLAWIRTALSILAGAVLVHQFASRLQPRGLVLAGTVLLCLLAAALCGLAYFRWRANEIAMRHAEPLPFPHVIPLLSVCLLLLGIFVGAMVAIA